jgi:hypothetical protein
MNDTLNICYDRILPKDLTRPIRTRSVATGPGAQVEAVFPDIRKLWMNGSTLRVRFLEGTPQQQAVAREQAGWWTEHANLKFDFNDALDAEIRIAFDSSDGAWSYIGTDAKSIPQDQPTMNLGFLDGGTAAHEFGHAIGLGHEHQNPAGGIEWNEAVVIRDLGGPPNSWTPAQVRHNVLEKYQVNHFLHGTKFDPDSIMLYAFPGTWTKSGQGTNFNKVLSEIDKAFIASAEAYPPTSTESTVLAVNGTPADGAIGKPGEEDIYVFTVAAAAHHIIETTGNTDVVMKLFGPDSQTNLIAEDDDSGASFNAKIVKDLLPGKYFVQIRHYNREQGTGAYTIRASNNG